jgi:hypothetical protein
MATCDPTKPSSNEMIRVVNVRPLAGYKLWVRFSDGLEGEYAVDPNRRGGVFDSLADPAVFNAVSTNNDFGSVEWPGGIDLCPIAMHQESVATSARDGPWKRPR